MSAQRLSGVTARLALGVLAGMSLVPLSWSPAQASPQQTAGVTAGMGQNPVGSLAVGLGSEFSLRDVGYQDQLIRGQAASVSYVIPGPGDRTGLDGSGFTLQFKDLNLPADGRVTVAFNDVQIGVYPVAAGRTATINADVPAPRINPDRNLLRLTFSAQPTDRCLDGSSPVATISSDSVVRYGRASQTGDPDLSRYPAPFLGKADSRRSTVQVILSGIPTAAEYSALASLGAGLGQSTAGPIGTSVYLADKVPPAVKSREHLVVIGTPENNALIHELATSLPLKVAGEQFVGRDGKPVPSDSGVLQAIPSPFAPGKSILVVTGVTDEGVKRSAQALISPDLRRTLSGQTGIVAAVQEQPADVAASPRTLTEAGYADQKVVGVGRHTVQMLIDGRPEARGGTLNVVYSQSQAAAVQSSLTVQLNQQTIGSIDLRETSATRASFQVPITPAVLRPGRNVLSFAFNFLGERADCSPAASSTATNGTIHGETALDLPAVPPAAPTLSAFPYPFVRAGSVRDTVLVLPSQPKTEDLSAAMDVAVQIGRAALTSTPWLSTITADDLTDDARRTRSIIALGLLAENSFIEKIQGELPAPFARLGGLGDVGIIEMTTSPWSRLRTDRPGLLVLSGTARESLVPAAAALAEGSLTGASVTVGRDGRPSTVEQQTGLAAWQAPRTAVPVGLTALTAIVIGALVVVMLRQTLRGTNGRQAGRAVR